MTRAGRARLLAALSAVGLASILEASALFRFYLSQIRLPLWDMAGHGWGGVELLQALAAGKPFHFLNLLNHQDKWPFGYSLLLLPFLAAGHASFASATLLSTVLFALIPALLVWVAWEASLPGPSSPRPSSPVPTQPPSPGEEGGEQERDIRDNRDGRDEQAELSSQVPLSRGGGWGGRERGRGEGLGRGSSGAKSAPVGIWAGLLAAALFLASPLPRVFAIVIMREMGGIAISLAATGFYLRARRLGTAWPWRLAGLTLLFLFLVKYNYFLILGLALLANEVWRRWPLHPSWSGWTKRKILLAVYLGLLVLVALLGINPGVGIYAGLVVGSVVLAMHWRRDRVGFSQRWGELPMEVRALLATVVLPLWIWGLSPDPIHPRSLFAFLRNRSAGPPLPSVESLLFYPRSLLNDYAAQPVLGLLAVFFALASLLRLRRSESWRPVVLTAFLGLALSTFHPYKEPRFLATTAPFLLLSAALAFAGLAHSLPRYGRLTGGLLCAAALVATAWTASGSQLDERLARDYRQYSDPPGIWQPLHFLSRKAAQVPRVAVVGTFNELSDSLVRWRLAQQEETRAVVIAEPVHLETRKPGKLHRWLAEERPARILALRLRPESPFYGLDYQRYNAWQLELIDRLEKDEGWREQRRRTFERLGLDVLVLEPGPRL